MGWLARRGATRRYLLHGARAASVLLAAAAAVPMVPGSAWAQPERAWLADPPANVPRTAAMDAACGTGGGQKCENAVLEAIDQARAAEGLGPLVLPAYYARLTVPEQLLVVTNLEREDRGLPGFTGLSSRLDALAQHGADTDSDPVGPSGEAWGSNWAGGEGTALLADYDWMYDDGPGSPNMDCTEGSATGCWAHRRNILADYGMHPSMGAAKANVDGVSSMTELFASGSAGPLAYTSPHASPWLVTPSSLVIGTTPSAPNSAALTVGGSSSSFRAVAEVSGTHGHWWVTPSCEVHARGTCHLVVGFEPARPGGASAMVTVRFPGGSEEVNVDAYAGYGYWEATSRGAVLAHAGAGYRGSVARRHLDQPVVGMAATPDGAGYWEVAADGGVFSFGDARFFGSAAEMHLGRSVVGMAPASGGHGYWVATRDGGIYSFGDARYYGSPGARAGDRVVGISSTPNGLGYWLVTDNGEVYSYGDARYFGPSVPLHLNERVVGMAAARDGLGYWLVTGGGSVYSFGDARYYGSAPAGSASDFVGVAVPVAGPGYYLTRSSGAVEALGGAPTSGGPAVQEPKGTVVAMATA